jgi:hypothetical protein
MVINTAVGHVVDSQWQVFKHTTKQQSVHQPLGLNGILVMVIERQKGSAAWFADLCWSRL